MSKILAFTNQKGGVGKTTSTANVGAGLARAGQRVLLVDLDPQANLTKGLGLSDAEQNVYGALLGEYPLKAYSLHKNLALVAGSSALSGFEKVKGDELDREFLLKDLLEPLRDRCDFILLDCPPALGLVTLNAYACAQALYIPLEAQLYATDGLEKVLDLVGRVQRRLNPDMKVGGVFFTRHDKRKVLRRDTAEQLRVQYPDLVLDTVIRESIALGEAPHLGKDIFSYAPQSAGAADYQALVAEILTR
ncbi:ParA family protein [Hymenobacter psychrophilus]|uniref:Chromosome partitioning protein n=1 Tax=Hymenobacter psychrophilus TaxID=651662 RepID=A0A1H3NZD8_9BACT|nr:ParA family protein [Hymenobacter psychrophilus]SDY94130.1 chromosome partitioning protein [Hymenobacter psychrophilus]